MVLSLIIRTFVVETFFMSSNYLEKIFSTNIVSVLVSKQFLFNKKNKYKLL